MLPPAGRHDGRSRVGWRSRFVRIGPDRAWTASQGSKSAIVAPPTDDPESLDGLPGVALARRSKTLGRVNEYPTLRRVRRLSSHETSQSI
jgi:hypothetical protein